MRKVKESENKSDDDGPDWFTAATKRREEEQEVHKHRLELQVLEKQELRVQELKQRRRSIKVSCHSNTHCCKLKILFTQ